jgi:hypothetical protein
MRELAELRAGQLALPPHASLLLFPLQRANECDP